MPSVNPYEAELDIDIDGAEVPGTHRLYGANIVFSLALLYFFNFFYFYLPARLPPNYFM